MTGIDKSARMLEQAQRRLGDDADLQVAELGSPLPFRDDTFDGVTASLVLHYLEDWGPALAELRRVLKPGGRLIVSVNHPFSEYLWHREAGLEPGSFAQYNYTVEWAAGRQSALLASVRSVNATASAGSESRRHRLLGSSTSQRGSRRARAGSGSPFRVR